MDDDELEFDEVEWAQQQVREFGRFWFEDGRPLPEIGPFVENGRGDALDAIEAALVAKPPASVALVGEEGAGKSAVVREVARRLRDRGWSIFEATSADAMAGQTYIGQVEMRLQAIATAGRGRPQLWILSDLLAAVSAGAWKDDPTGLLGRLLPFLERGEIVVLAEIQPADWVDVVQRRPRVRTTFTAVRLEPLEPPLALDLVDRRLEHAGTSLPRDVLREAHALADHYLPPVSLPGHLVRLTDAAVARALRNGELPAVLGIEHVVGALAEATGLPLAILDERQRLDLDELRSYFEQRVLGQDDATDCLVERLALIKAGLTDPTGPLGVFLFVGPTGTGKTELAKTLAEYLFGSASRLVRLDMSEYQTPDSLERLLAGPESSESAGLIEAVRRQPFSVVLLDEFEKAAAPIWDVFLQLFDDGRLTDRSGRSADFRHSVVILTSNLGVGARRRGPLGFGDRDDRPHDPATTTERAVADTFRPEFVNRLDRIVVFRPLDRAIMRRLVEKELDDVSERRGLRTRPWAIEWDASAVDFLLERGFTEDLGARPLKRAVETHVLVPLARAIVERHVPQGDQFLFVRSGGAGIEVEFVDPETELPSSVTPAAGAVIEDVAAEPTGTDEEAALVEAEVATLRQRIGGDEWREDKERLLARTGEGDFWDAPDRNDVLERAEYVDRIEAGLRTAESLLERLRRARRDKQARATELARLVAQRAYVLREAVAALDEGEAFAAYLAVRAGVNGAEFGERVLSMYRDWAGRRGMRMSPLGVHDGDVRTFVVTGFGAYRILKHESGLHVLEVPRGESTYDRAVVHVLVLPKPIGPPDDSEPVRAEETLAAARWVDAITRRYRETPSPLVRDARGWRTGRIERVLRGDFDLVR